MKAQYIYEKFQENSDPIADLGIGILNRLKTLDVLICKKSIQPRTFSEKFIINPGNYCVIKEIEILRDKKIHLNLITYSKYPSWVKKSDFEFAGNEYLLLTKEQFFEHFEIAKGLNEKFVEDSDPIKDLKIGVEHQIRKWVRENTQYDDTVNYTSLLWICAKYGKLEFVKFLVEIGADVSYNKYFAYRLATKSGHFNVVKYLLDKGSDARSLPFHEIMNLKNIKIKNYIINIINKNKK